MKIRYFVHCYEGYDANDPYDLFRRVQLIDATQSMINGFNKYLLSALSSDFLDYHPEHCDIALQKIAQIEAGEIEEYMWEGQGFLHYIKPDSVLFEHAIFGECPEWPLWTCSLAQYKAALKGWKDFIQMPKSIESELIVEMPDN